MTQGSGWGGSGGGSNDRPPAPPGASPPPQPAYPPQQPAYPQQQQPPGFAPQQPAYPQQPAPGFAPQQPAYPQQPAPGFAPQQPVYPQQQQPGYAPQQPTYPQPPPAAPGWGPQAQPPPAAPAWGPPAQQAPPPAWGQPPPVAPGWGPGATQGSYGAAPGAPPGGYGPPPGAPPGYRAPGGYAPLPAGYAPGVAASTSGAWSPVDALSFGWERMKADFGTIFGAFFVPQLLLGVLVGGGIGVAWAVGIGSAMAEHARPGRHGSSAPPDITRMFEDATTMAVMGLTVVALWLVMPFVQAGLSLFALKVARGDRYTFSDVFGGAPYYATFLGASLLVGLAVGFGLMFCLVPGIFLALGWSLTGMVAVDRNLGAVDAMRESWRLTVGQKGNLFVLFLLYGAATVVVSFIPCIGSLATAFVLPPVLQLASAYAYLRISGQQTAG